MGLGGWNHTDNLEKMIPNEIDGKMYCSAVQYVYKELWSHRLDGEGEGIGDDVR